MSSQPQPSHLPNLLNSWSKQSLFSFSFSFSFPLSLLAIDVPLPARGRELTRGGDPGVLDTEADFNGLIEELPKRGSDRRYHPPV